MAALGRRLAGDEARLTWVRGEVSAGAEPEPHDLVVASYVMGEMEGKARSEALQKAWRATRVALVVVEPGTVPGFERIRILRSELVSAGGHVIAPCPHSGDCPMAAFGSPGAGGDWCHFPERVERTSLHRILKAGTLGYEDEKYSYVVATRDPIEPAAARIIRHPERRPGLAKLALCGREGLETATVTRKDRELWRKARKAGWGGEWG
jgi:ribosomal protein RSM22 (predicted rRNA methylase)